MAFTKSMEPAVAEEYSDVTLEVEVSHEKGEVQWMRQGVVIHPGPKFTLKQNGRKRSITIHKLALSDRGTYSCETLHDRTQARLSVERESARVALFSLCGVVRQSLLWFTAMVPYCGPLRCCCLKQIQLTKSNMSKRQLL